MADAYEKAREEFINSIERIAAQVGNGAGLPRRILAYLMFTPRPVSLDELCERLGAAKSGVSVNARVLENHGLVRKAWVKGERKDFYEADFKIAELKEPIIELFARFVEALKDLSARLEGGE